MHLFALLVGAVVAVTVLLAQKGTEDVFGVLRVQRKPLVQIGLRGLCHVTTVPVRLTSECLCVCDLALLRAFGGDFPNIGRRVQGRYGVTHRIREVR